MKREQITDRMLKVFCDTSDMHMSYREMAVVAAKEAERLLADEREKAREMFIEELATAIRQLDLTAPSSTEEGEQC